MDSNRSYYKKAHSLGIVTLSKNLKNFLDRPRDQWTEQNIIENENVHIMDRVKSRDFECFGHVMQNERKYGTPENIIGKYHGQTGTKSQEHFIAEKSKNLVLHINN
ncbi:hypothetical protein JTB14_011964 [Gonioctena quinquepunctata]|nr:hypothetical protein JTB14_011964 [Gonioctena quinquepunctata]